MGSVVLRGDLETLDLETSKEKTFRVNWFRWVSTMISREAKNPATLRGATSDLHAGRLLYIRDRTVV